MKMPKIEIYRDDAKEWRWRLKATNGKIVAVSGEGYKNKASILKVLRYLTEADEVWV
jgi:uncharacterized protein